MPKLIEHLYKSWVGAKAACLLHLAATNWKISLIWRKIHGERTFVLGSMQKILCFVSRFIISNQIERVSYSLMLQ